MREQNECKHTHLGLQRFKWLLWVENTIPSTPESPKVCSLQTGKLFLCICLLYFLLLCFCLPTFGSTHGLCCLLTAVPDLFQNALSSTTSASLSDPKLCLYYVQYPSSTIHPASLHTFFYTVKSPMTTFPATWHLPHPLGTTKLSLIMTNIINAGFIGSFYFNIKKNRRSLLMQTVFNGAEDKTELLWKLTCLCKLSHFTQGMTRVTWQAAQGTIQLGCRAFGHMFNESFKLRMRRFPREVKQNMKTSRCI